LELTRLWVKDGTKKNTESYFLARTFTWLRENTNVKVLLSYSDPKYNHFGTIYQASNWLYQGNNIRKVKSYYYIVNNEMYHPRTASSKFGSLKDTVISAVDPQYERIEMENKHRYIYILHKRDRKKIIQTLKHPILPYPKK